MKPIEQGTVISCLSPGKSYQGIRVQGQHIFDYIHVDVLASGVCDSQGNILQAVVYSTTTIGAIIDLGSASHLHLDQLEYIGGSLYDVNPQQNGLEFADEQPGTTEFDAPIYENLQLGNATDDIIPVTFGQGQPPNGSSTPTPLQPANGGTGGSYIVPGGGLPIGILTTADGSQLATRRKGIYDMTVTVAPASNPSQLIYNLDDVIQFDALNNSAPTLGIADIYYSYWANSQTYFGTNSGIPCNQNILSGCDGQQTLQNTIDPSQLTGDPNGIYNLSVVIGGLVSPGVENQDIDSKALILNPLQIGLLQDDVTPVPNGGTATSPNIYIGKVRFLIDISV